MIVRTKNVQKNAAKFLKNLIEDSTSNKDKVVLGVVGGRSADKTFEYLSNEDLDWKKVHIFMVDERQVPIDNEHSNFKIVKKYFSKTAAVLHPYDVEKGIEEYALELEKVGGKYDILFLSSGEDGHIGALYPNHHSIQDYSEFFIEMEDSPKMPLKRMSASYNLILKTTTAVILFLGKEKKEALQKFLNPYITIQDCPAKLIQEIEKYYVITDLK